MELKVWVEGIQRVVCGVNEKTTCQDVVYALAHATGKTGRFTLIERWRNSERLLAPGEQPLKVLLKWGEHSNDVQFILQWSPLDSSNNSSKTTSPGKSGQSGNNNNTTSGGGDNLSDNYPSLFKPGYASSGVSGSSTNQSNCVPLNNGFSPSTPSSSSKKFSHSNSSYHTPNNLPNQRPSAASQPGNSNSSTKQFSHLNGSSGGGGKLQPSEATSGVMKGAPQRLIHSDAIKDFSSSSSVTSGKVSSSSPGGSSLQQAPPSLASKMKELSAPPPYREPPNPISYQGKVSPSVSSPSNINSPSLKGLPLPPYREPPPPTMMQQQQQSPSQYSNAYQLRHNSSNSPARGVSNVSVGSQSFFGSSVNSSSSSLLNNGGTTSSNSISASGVPSSKDSPSRHGPPLATSQASQLETFLSSHNSASDKSETSSFWCSKEQSLLNGEPSSTDNQNGSANKAPTAVSHSAADSPNSHYKDLVRLVNSQREKLTSQQAELTQYDAEIMFWEGKAKEQQRNMEFITKEISRLEVISAQNENQVLSLSHLEEENEYVRQESESLKIELTSLKSELGKCENELDKCRNRLRKLADDLQTTQIAMTQRQDEWLERETAALSEVERVKKELEVARRETDAVSDLSGSLDKEVHSLESTLAEKKKQMEQLVSAMKEANLQSLIINPPDEVVDGGVHQRSGSTRRMIGSPRQLENAAPTSKNPHGVWV